MALNLTTSFFFFSFLFFFFFLVSLVSPVFIFIFLLYLFSFSGFLSVFFSFFFPCPFLLLFFFFPSIVSFSPSRVPSFKLLLQVQQLHGRGEPGISYHRTLLCIVPQGIVRRIKSIAREQIVCVASALFAAHSRWMVGFSGGLDGAQARVDIGTSQSSKWKNTSWLDCRSMLFTAGYMVEHAT